MVSDRNRLLRYASVGLLLAWGLWAGFGFLSQGIEDDRFRYAAAARHLEDRHFDEALAEYNRLLSDKADDLAALRGKAQALMQLGRYGEALKAYDRAIELEPDYGVTYANRGILLDRMGDYQAAIADYERSAALTPEVAEGPGWMDRFLYNRPEKPPTVASRARYLREQLARPEAERLLRVPELDQDQLMLRM